MSLISLKLRQSQLEAAAGFTQERKPVEQINPETGEVLRVHNSVTAAANFVHMAWCSIGNCCHGKQKISAGFKWRFYTGPPLDCKYM